MPIIAGAVAALVLAVGGGIAWFLQSGPEQTTGAGVPGAVAGTWSGEMSQMNEDGEHVIDWGAKVKLETGAEQGSAEWFTLNCRGSLKLTERDGEELVFDYIETYDPGRHCVDESELSLRPGTSTGTLEAEWHAVSGEGTPMISSGTLN